MLRSWAKHLALTVRFSTQKVSGELLGERDEMLGKLGTLSQTVVIDSKKIFDMVREYKQFIIS